MGGRIGLEAIELLSGKDMRDLAAVIAAIAVMHPNRLVFFRDLATDAEKSGSASSALLKELGYQ